jgi:hypothetical protein
LSELRSFSVEIYMKLERRETPFARSFAPGRIRFFERVDAPPFSGTAPSEYRSGGLTALFGQEAAVIQGANDLQVPRS